MFLHQRTVHTHVYAHTCPCTRVIDKGSCRYVTVMTHRITCTYAFSFLHVCKHICRHGQGRTGTGDVGAGLHTAVDADRPPRGRPRASPWSWRTSRSWTRPTSGRGRRAAWARGSRFFAWAFGARVSGPIGAGVPLSETGVAGSRKWHTIGPLELMSRADARLPGRGSASWRAGLLAGAPTEAPSANRSRDRRPTSRRGRSSPRRATTSSCATRPTAPRRSLARCHSQKWEGRTGGNRKDHEIPRAARR